MSERVIIKGTILTYGEKFIVGEDVFSSILLSVVNSWYYTKFDFSGNKKYDYSELESREYGKIKFALYGFTEDLHNLSINFGLLNEIRENEKIGKLKGNLYLSLILENLFTNIRSIYDFFYHFIKICLNPSQLRQFPEKDSLNKLITFSENPNNKEKLPESIIWYLSHIKTDLENIRKIRDSIIHKGKEIFLTRKSGKILMRVPISEKYSNDNLLPNILNTEEIDYEMEAYLSKLFKTTFTNLETLGVIIYNEINKNEDFKFDLYSISNYCIDDFNLFLLTKKFG